MSDHNPLPDRLRVAQLSASRPNPFDLKPDASRREAVAAELGISALPEMRFVGEVRASGADEWALNGVLTARVVQPCVITLDPVTTRLKEQVALLFSPHISTPEEEEIEMGDDTIEPLGQWIELGNIAIEALSLALPTRPLSKGAEMPEAAMDPDEAEEEPKKPFAGLADLLKAKEDDKS